MPSVLIVIDERSSLSLAIATGMEQAIAASESTLAVETLTATELGARFQINQWQLDQDILCPLTLQLPAQISLPNQSTYQACHDVPNLRQRVAEWGTAIGVGNFWLPIVLTAKGALFAEVIGQSRNGTESTPIQPVDLSDRWRQPLYQLGLRLLRSLNAAPSVYLMQFGTQTSGICFDRLFPFPGTPAIASLNVQTPDLFACHWRCLQGQPIHDLTINAASKYVVFPQA
jgi:hypothetical protein